MIAKEVDGVRFALREDCDVTWLGAYGQVFAVFDQQDSGNICFGVDDGTRRLFLKYAGARTIDYEGTPVDAILRLRHAAPIYQDLAHPNLVRLLAHGDRGAGYACIYDWVDGECLHAHWDFDQHPKHTHPQSPNYRFRRLPLDKKLACLDAIYRFHLHAAAKGYVAIDFYDGSIMYDFETDTTTICDIDFYRPSPVTNQMGRLWGSSRFMSPEEHELGATIDEVTNVYAMGATAFELLGDNRARSAHDWVAPMALYCVATKATSPERNARFPSISLFVQAWQDAMVASGCSVTASQ